MSGNSCQFLFLNFGHITCHLRVTLCLSLKKLPPPQFNSSLNLAGMRALWLTILLEQHLYTAISTDAIMILLIGALQVLGRSSRLNFVFYSFGLKRQLW